ncbi:LOW QUALITY PROTEIN: diacylglycerol diphosphate phosphatase / phosphatidate phosphatase [Geosmithia morbida]|uniref:Diacylglycerol diphosphate phosphatase / phosphatidate phosphatase n=1 Tax=Geosmithia morbida TaxID=1094350 RepID=A0A9P4YRN8_9HYPO|nr:LOW QUALITY PROTEIN: diacylglycerol diphosphate phosphatase / phosphatidate phosphatase [Geosmithia morbida]KAF4121868.1 LOW QUALITY PROTEIN: diacylglycerol diphosphate phosphatase / phosphatidate phosphatase [Geosmithia morbida]
MTKSPIIRAACAFIRQWAINHWADVIWMAVIGAASFGLDRAPIPTKRTFPITFDTASGDVVYPDMAYPERGWLLPSWLAGFLALGIPLTVYSAAQVRMRSVWDADAAIMGTLWAVLLATFFQVVTKILVGGLRPYFLDVCRPDVSSISSAAGDGLNGVGFNRIMYTVDVCTQSDPRLLRNAMTSFPSGHSAAGFAGYGFLHLWLNARLKVWADYRPALWKLLAVMMPLFIAFLNACLLSVDAAHHWYDIVVGSIIGVVMALAAYRATHAALWDSRYNHLCLRAREAFIYNADADVDYSGRTLTGKVGWGDDRTWVTDGRVVGVGGNFSSSNLGGSLGQQGDGATSFLREKGI